MKKLICVLCVLALAAGFSGCVKQTQTENPAQGATVSFTDDAGRTVELPAKIERVACAGTMAQIVAFPITADMLVGLSGKWGSNTEQYIADKYLKLPIFGQFYGADDLNLEAIAAADPQVIIDIGEPKKTIVEDMDEIAKQIGIPTVFIEASLDKMPQTYRTLGKLLGLEEKAEKLAQYCEGTLSDTKSKMAEVGDKKVSLLYLQGDAGLNVIAQASYHAELINLVSDNAAVVDEPSSKGSGNEVSMEQLLLWNPDVIIFAPGSVYATVGSDKTWQGLKAISSGNYFEAPADPYNWMGFPPSVNRYMGMKWLAQLLYPEVF
ncbi:MAG: ABC transporter substrate-binding protein, partial [Oscillospiraceae bacterium]